MTIFKCCGRKMTLSTYIGTVPQISACNRSLAILIFTISLRKCETDVLVQPKVKSPVTSHVRHGLLQPVPQACMSPLEIQMNLYKTKCSFLSVLHLLIFVQFNLNLIVTHSVSVICFCFCLIIKLNLN